MYRSTRRSAKLLIAAGVAAAISLAAAASLNVFAPFAQIDGVEQAQPISPSLGGFALNSRNAFFDPGLGTNGQACVTCHQPADGYDIHVESIQAAFNATNNAAGNNPLAMDPLFRANDTADDPNADVSTPAARTNAFKLFLNLGVIRFARPAAGISNASGLQDFTIAPLTDAAQIAQFGMLPHTGDPESPAATTISVFRRPLINLNVRFDSSLLWDGREKISDLRTQVAKAARSLLLAQTVSTADADAVAAFMLGVNIDAVSNSTFNVGNNSAAGSTAGIQNLVNLSFDPAQPCRFDSDSHLTSSTFPPLGLLTPSSCTPVVPGNAT